MPFTSKRKKTNNTLALILLVENIGDLLTNTITSLNVAAPLALERTIMDQNRKNGMGPGVYMGIQQQTGLPNGIDTESYLRFYRFRFKRTVLNTF